MREPRIPAASFDAVAVRYRGEILRYLMRVTGSRTDAEDVCQDVLLRAHRAYPTLRDRSHVRAWLFTIATRTAANFRRGRRRVAIRRTDIDPETLPSPTRKPGLNTTLVRAVDRLPRRQRAALMLRVFHDHDYRQIAVALECTPAAARANVYQAIQRLKRLLHPATEEERDNES